ncbi:MAG: hypothetical protein H6Q43_2806, partial [Deltaproteobacteria bacterium]|nr:hypothetical protein [Deltaproteobacteria bacterium]
MPVLSSLFPHKKVEQRDSRAETAEVRIGKRGITTFFDE